MCGRYTLMTEMSQLAEAFNLAHLRYDQSPRTNIAPTQDVPVIRMQADGRALEGYRWGLIPSWAKDPKIGFKMINARAETVASKPSFRNLLPRHRVAVIADGYYEWKKEGKEKQPFRFQLESKAPFAFAGLYDEWESPEDGELIRSCTIITTEPNPLAAEVHNRMPVILSAGALDTWLDPNVTDKEQLQQLLVPYPADQMIKYPVSKAVGKVTNSQLNLIEEVNLNSK
ncbi:SOS response-associated peptidase [Paenibacillus bovis]|uniref:Abasic site processing protein n=1 Tax=Paenibacillus bovis TaxID=1616788 RepID=A0A1X9T4J1_9BACL|nr:SOS response-associated peptidase [Paenibacillus bovis]ARR10786.1 hypothetical protein AR543_p0178 [Paenibacillus bovis]